MRSFNRIGAAGFAAVLVLAAGDGALAGRVGSARVALAPHAEKFAARVAVLAGARGAPRDALDAATALVRRSVDTLGSLIRAATGRTQRALRIFSLHFARELDGIASRLLSARLAVGMGLLDRMRAELEKALGGARDVLHTHAKQIFKGGLPNLGGFATRMLDVVREGMDLAKQIARGAKTRRPGQMAELYKTNRASIDAAVRSLEKLLRNPLSGTQHEPRL